MSGQPPPTELADAVRRVSGALTAHAGGVELVSIERGTARVRFVGACTGCPARPMTLVQTVRPGLLDVPGVDRVEAVGVRLDAEQEARLLVWQRAGQRLTEPAAATTTPRGLGTLGP